MQHFSPPDLRDPQPPVPGERERTLVAERARELGRRRRLAQGGGALALVAVVAVSVAALTGGGGSAGTRGVEAASGTDTPVSTTVGQVTTTAPTTVAPAPEPTVAPAPAPAPETTPAAASSEAAPPPAVSEAPAVEPAPPSGFTLSGAVTGNPADTTVTVTVHGPGGPYTSSGNSFSLSGLSAGEYMVIAVWEDSTGTATAAVKQVVNLTGDASITLSF
jgi:hypothetical protein